MHFGSTGNTCVYPTVSCDYGCREKKTIGWKHHLQQTWLRRGFVGVLPQFANYYFVQLLQINSYHYGWSRDKSANSFCNRGLWFNLFHLLWKSDNNNIIIFKYMPILNQLDALKTEQLYCQWILGYWSLKSCKCSWSISEDRQIQTQIILFAEQITSLCSSIAYICCFHFNSYKKKGDENNWCLSQMQA